MQVVGDGGAMRELPLCLLLPPLLLLRVYVEVVGSVKGDRVAMRELSLMALGGDARVMRLEVFEMISMWRDILNSSSSSTEWQEWPRVWVVVLWTFKLQKLTMFVCWSRCNSVHLKGGIRSQLCIMKGNEHPVSSRMERFTAPVLQTCLS